MNELVWPIVVLLLGGLAWHRAGQRAVKSENAAGMQAWVAAMPSAEDLMSMIDSLQRRIGLLETSGHNLPAIVARANDLTKDMLSLKTVLAEHRDALALLRTKNSLRAGIGGDKAG